MRRIAGWLCYISLLSTIGFTCYYCYLTLAPFFRGGEVDLYLPYRDESRALELSRQLGQHADRSAGSLLRGYVMGAGRSRSLRGWDAWTQLVEAWNTPKAARKPVTKPPWAAVADDKGVVVASYPPDLAANLGRVQVPSKEGWLGALGPDQRFSRKIYVVSFPTSHRSLPVRFPGTEGSQGYDVDIIVPDKSASLAVAYPPRPEKIAVIPPWAEVHGWMSPLGAAIAAVVSLLAFLILVPTWVALDAEWRGTRSFAWAALILITGPFGLAAYLLARPRPPKPCPNCGETIQSGFRRCPACGVSLLITCPRCGRRMQPGWQTCPICSGEQPQTPRQPEPVEPAVTTARPVPGAAPSIGPISPMGPMAPAPASGLTVSVSDAESGAPLANARVAIAGPVTVEALTNRNGTFEARKLCTGHYSITVTLDGYEPAHDEADVDEGCCQVARITLSAAPAGIGGKVLDRQSMNPVCGAQVYLDSSRVDRSATTLGDGAFELGNIPPGPYTVGVEAEGFVSQTRLVEAAPGRRASADFVLDAEPRADQ